jgi:hypothetical protein
MRLANIILQIRCFEHRQGNETKPVLRTSPSVMAAETRWLMASTELSRAIGVPIRRDRVRSAG